VARPTVRGARDVPALRDWLLRAWRANGNDGWGALALRALPDAALWYVPADTIDLASAAAETLPDNVVLDHHLTPPGACFIYFETSRLTGDTHAVLVHPVAGAGDSPPGLVLTGVSLRNDHQAKVGNSTWAYGHSWQDPTPVVPPGVDDDFDPETDRIRHAMALGRRQLAALWLMAHQPHVVDLSDLAPTRAQARRAQRGGQAPPTVRVVNLRRTIYEGAEAVPDDTAGGRRYRVRWPVRPHWRQQAYGPGRRYRKTILVPPHIKGPAGAPFAKNTTVHLLNAGTTPPRPLDPPPPTGAQLN
jgi:hypothetical protein